MGVYGAVFHYHKISRNINSFSLMQLRFHRRDSLGLSENSAELTASGNVMDDAGICILRPVQNRPHSGAEKPDPQPLGVPVQPPSASSRTRAGY